MTIAELDRELNQMIVAGKNRDAFLKFYAEDVIRQENDGPEQKGRDAWMAYFAEMAKNIKRVEARLLASAVGEDVSLSEWDVSMEMAGQGVMRMKQAAVRTWKNGRIVREVFYHT